MTNFLATVCDSLRQFGEQLSQHLSLLFSIIYYFLATVATVVRDKRVSEENEKEKKYTYIREKRKNIHSKNAIHTTIGKMPANCRKLAVFAPVSP